MKRITFLVDDETYERLRVKAFEQRRKMSDLIREGLEIVIDTPVAKPPHGGPRAHPPKPKNSTQPVEPRYYDVQES
jgi:hypothetical protein